jgi:hypothetical protein
MSLIEFGFESEKKSEEFALMLIDRILKIEIIDLSKTRVQNKFV